MTGFPQDQLAEALAALKKGGVILFPTDTVYGLGCAVESPEATRRIYDLKGRPPGQPLQILIAEPPLARRYAKNISSGLWGILESLWPGGLTALLPAVDGLPTAVVGPKGTVGLRAPDFPPLQSLLSAAGGAIAATSANLSGQPPACRMEDVPEEIIRQVDFVLDAGALPDRPASTVVDFTVDPPRVIRAGAISKDRLAEFGVE